MKTRAFDPVTKQWRTDYVVSPAGSVFQTTHYKMDLWELEPRPNWKLSRFSSHVDINKNEIYENHIVKLASGSIGIVVFENGSFIVDIKKHSEEFEFYEWPVEYFTKYDYDDGYIPGALIIGDVFQNHELLEV